MVLTYPFLFIGVGGLIYSDLTADTFKMGLENLKGKSNIIREFFSREDASEVMFQKYEELQVDYELLLLSNP